MEPKFSKKMTVIVASAVILLTGGGVGVALLVAPTDSDSPPPAAAPAPTVVEPPKGIIDPTAVLTEEQLRILPETTQYLEGPARRLGEVITYTYPGSEGSTYTWAFPAELVPTATWTAEEYIEGAIFNPYFITDWWGTKDDQKISGPNSHIYPFLSDELQAQFSEKAQAYASGDAEAEAWLAGLLFLPGDLEVRDGCYENWDAGVCWTDNEAAGKITSASAVFTSQTTVDLTVTAVTDVQYQHPGYQDGSIGSQQRTYELKMTLQFAEGPTPENLDDTENPYMEITAIDGTVTVGEVADYLIFADLPPAP